MRILLGVFSVGLLWFAAAWSVSTASAQDAPASEAPAKEASASPLRKYLEKPDNSYAWSKRREGQLGTGTFVELTLTSQTWRGIVWKHQLYIIKPSKVSNASQGLMMIGGGRWRPELEAPPQEGDQLPREAQLLAQAAELIKSPVAVILHVPHQPIFDGMVEDEIISYTFEQYLKSRDEEWPLLLPMVKSAVRAMDAVQDFSKKEWQLDIKNFTVTGGSKRGWTTWLTGASDSRVNAIAPMVIDVLNMPAQMKHQLATWGKFSEQIEDYTRRGIQQQMDTPPGRRLNEIVDPFAYRALLKQPKLILLGTNDRYWPLDALNLYWPELVGEKHVCYVPNHGHSLRDPNRVIGGIVAIHRAVSGEIRLPRLSWDLNSGNDGLRLSVVSDIKPEKVLAWIATAPTRDFRDARWEPKELQLNGKGYDHLLPTPESGFAAMFGEAIFPSDVMPFYLSTNVKIIEARNNGSK